MATIYDVARRARVSTYTVSAVLNRSAPVSEELTTRVLQAARELDYTINRVAASLQTRRSMTVGMLIPDIANPWYGKVVRAVEDVCNASGYALFLSNTHESAETQERALSALRSRQVDGVLLFPAPESEPMLVRLQAARLPFVVLGRRPLKLDCDSVTADNRTGTRMAVEHLVMRGHRRIGIITGPKSLSANRDRVAGWRQALRACGIEAAPEWVQQGDGSGDSAHRACAAMLRTPDQIRPTAIFAANLLMMTGVLAALKERGLRVPRDTEVMCSDDSDWLDVFEPHISVVLQPGYEMGERAARLLLSRLAEPERGTETVVLKPELKLRWQAPAFAGSLPSPPPQRGRPARRR